MDLIGITEERRERLRSILCEKHLDALLVYHAANRYYLSGFELHDPQCNESSGCLLILADGKDWLCTDSRYIDAAKRLWDENRLCIYKEDPPKDIATLINKLLPQGSIGYESKALSVNFFEKFFETLNGVQAIQADGIIEQLRVIKDSHEISLIEQSCFLNHELMGWVPSILLPGESESSIALKVEAFFREHGASELSFPTIVACGPNAALPHATPNKNVHIEKEQLVLIDAGARLFDYCSDQTCTFWVGVKPSEQFQKRLSLVQEAQRKGIEAIRPGVMAKDVYHAAYSFFEKYGVEKAFTHSLGHGIGLETHEFPRLNARSETILEPGMVITVEPGLYYSGWGGVRWECMILVTEFGAKIL